MLTEETKIIKAEVLEDGQVQVCEATIIYRDGVEVSRTKHRYVLDPGVHTADDVAAKTAGKNGVSVGDITATVWKPQVVAHRKAFIAAQTEHKERRQAPQAGGRP